MDNEKKIDVLEEKLIWIFGTPRSGSTWLANEILKQEDIIVHNELMIGAHLGAFRLNPSSYWNLHEGNYNINFTRLFERTSLRHNNQRKDYFFSEDFTEVWSKLLKNFIANRLLVQHGTSDYNHLIVRSPNESHGADLLMQCFPKSKLIFLVRDGRDVIDSRHGKFFSPRREIATKEEREFRFSYFAILWNTMIDVTSTAFDSHNPELRLLVKYENLRSNSVSEIKRIYQFLNYELSDEKIQKIAEETSFEKVPNDLKGDDKNIRKARPGAFKEYFSAEEIDFLNSIMKTNLIKFGYKI